MNCFYCHRNIGTADIGQRVEWRRQGEEIRVYGNFIPDSPLKQARGALAKVSHRKCYFADKKRQQLLAAKAADPPAQRDQDWRDQEVRDVEELR